MSVNSSKNSVQRAKDVRQTLSRRWPLLERIVKGIGITLWVMASFFGGAFATAILLIFLIKLGLPYQTFSEALRSTIEAALVFVLSAAIALYIPKLLFKRPINRTWLGLDRQLTWKDLLLGTISFVPYLLLAALVIASTHSVLQFDLNQEQDVGFNTISTSVEYVLAFFTLVIAAPIAEEILFRGYLYGRIRRIFGFVITSIVVSAVFGALHGQWNVGVNVFALSLVLCALREYTGSIWAGIVLHMVKNAIAFYGLFIAHL